MSILGRLLRGFSARRRPSAGAGAGRKLGAQLAMQNRYAEAIDALRSVHDPLLPDAQTANLMGVCHSLLEQYPEAMRCYDEAIGADAGLAEAYLNGGITAFLLGSGDSKRKFLQWLALHGGSRPPLWSGPRRELPGVTLCCVDSAYHDLAAAALRASLAACAFGDALFLSDRDCHVEGLRFAKIAPIGSAAAYSNFMLHELHAHIRTEFALVIQYDGFVLNPEAWDPALLEYDYAGAPMPVGDRLVVGNGGFSLRSRKLLHALRDDAQIRAYDAARDTWFEDVTICSSFRRRLEEIHGIRFAPAELADRFAAGRKLPTRDSFGFHGLIHLVRLHEEAFQLPAATEDGIEVVFRAQTALGAITARRRLEVSGDRGGWA